MALNLVTGGCGFIGTHLVRVLKERGESVRVLDLKPPVERLADVEYQLGSIGDGPALEAACRGCRRVFHLAALSELWAPDKSTYVTVNLDGTRNVLETAQRAGVKTVVHTSSETVLVAAGRGRRPQTVDEQTVCRLKEMAGAYCRSKFLAEAEACKAVAAGQRVILVTPTIPVGPGDPRVTPPTRMMLGFLNGSYPAYLACTLHLADVRDIARGHWLAAEHGEPGGRYILGAHDLPLRRLLALLGELAGRDLHKPRIPFPLALGLAAAGELWADRFSRRPPSAPLTGVRLAGVPVALNNVRTREQLEWSPRPLEESLRDAIADYRGRGLM